MWVSQIELISELSVNPKKFDPKTLKHDSEDEF
jgi:hypothetical protein